MHTDDLSFYEDMERHQQGEEAPGPNRHQRRAQAADRRALARHQADWFARTQSAIRKVLDSHNMGYPSVLRELDVEIRKQVTHGR